MLYATVLCALLKFIPRAAQESAHLALLNVDTMQQSSPCAMRSYSHYHSIQVATPKRGINDQL